MKRYLFQNLLLLTVFILNACSNQSSNESKSTKPSVFSLDASIAKRVEFIIPVEAAGTVIASESIEIRPEVNGRIIHLHLNDGKKVSKGELLVKLNDAEQVAQLNKLKTQYDLAVLNEQRLKKLLDMKGVNQADYDAALLNVNTLKADIAYTQALIAKTEIRAPFSGVLGLRTVSEGAMVGTQDVLSTLKKTDEVKIDFVLPEHSSGGVKTGMTVKVITDKGKEGSATVVGVESGVNSATGNLKVRAVMNGNPLNLNPGAFVRVICSDNSGKDGIFVNTNCLIPEARVMKIALIKNSKISFQNVETGYRTGEKILIKSGLNPGDTFA